MTDEEYTAEREQQLAGHFLAVEIGARNDAALDAWRERLMAHATFPDAWSPVWRERLTFWFEEQRELALRWMFKTRAARRMPTWARLAKVYRP